MKRSSTKIIIICTLLGTIVVGILLDLLVFAYLDRITEAGTNTQTSTTAPMLADENTSNEADSSTAPENETEKAGSIGQTAGSTEQSTLVTDTTASISMPANPEADDTGMADSSSVNTSAAIAPDTSKPSAEGEEKPGQTGVVTTDTVSELTDAEYQELKSNIDSFREMVSKAEYTKINPASPAVSRLGSDVNAVQEAQKSLENTIDNFDLNAGKVKPSEVSDSNADRMRAVNVSISMLSSTLKDKFDDLNAAKKDKNMGAIKNLLKEIGDVLNSASTEIGELNSIIE